MNAARVPLGRLVLYVLPAGGMTVLASPALSLLPGIYATRYGIPMAAIGVVLLIARLFDAVTDPLVGVLADRTKASRGTRKPWIAVGTVIAVIGALLLYAPPWTPTATTLLAAMLVFYAGWTAFEIPHNAWVTSLAPDYADRGRAFAVRSAAFYLGNMAAFALPLLMPGSQGQFSPDVLLGIWAVGASVVIAGTVVALRRVPDPPSVERAHEPSLAAGWRAISHNRPLLLFIAAYVVSGFGFGMSLTLSYVYMQSVVGIADKLALIYLLSTPAALVGILLWAALIPRLGKNVVWLCVTVGASLVFLAFLAVPKTPAAFASVLGLNLLLFFLFSGLGVAAPAALADIVDYGRLRFGEDMGGTYYSLFAMMTKAAVGVAGGLGFALAGAFGFDAQARANPPEANRGFMLAFSVIPAGLVLLAVPLILAQPIDRRRHTIIARALGRAAARRGAAGERRQAQA